jgi:hypothetical protein
MLAQSGLYRSNPENGYEINPTSTSGRPEWVLPFTAWVVGSAHFDWLLSTRFDGAVAERALASPPMGQGLKMILRQFLTVSCLSSAALIAVASQSLVPLGAMAQSSITSPKHVHLFRYQHSAQRHCPNDKVVWANTTSRTLHLPGDPHHAHTHGGYACQGAARASGYHGPVVHG